MYTGKVIKMENSEFNYLKRALDLLDRQREFLAKEKEEDPTIQDLGASADDAWACLSDYLDAYNAQFVKEDDI